jgi:hypothetical protein
VRRANFVCIAMLSQMHPRERNELQLDMHMSRAQGRSERRPGDPVRELRMQRLRLQRFRFRRQGR